MKRNIRAGVDDLWNKTVREPDGSIRTLHNARYGRGMRWRARNVDDYGQEHTKAFTRKPVAPTWLDTEITRRLATGTGAAWESQRSSAAGRNLAATVLITSNPKKRGTGGWTSPSVQPRFTARMQAPSDTFPMTGGESSAYVSILQGGYGCLRRAVARHCRLLKRQCRRDCGGGKRCARSAPVDRRHA
jgi:hypothetical protein